MAAIHHRVKIKQTPLEVHQALATIDGLSSWWTTTIAGASEPGETLTFSFDDHRIVMRVEVIEPGKAVAWRCIGSSPEWVGTEVRFDLEPTEDGTFVCFQHVGWQQEGPFFAHCSTKWATFMLSLKQLVETGEGSPFPRDIPI